MAEKNELSLTFKHLDLENCFNNFYVVPDYQREYVWEEKEVKQLLEDIFDEYESNDKKEYFIGSIVVYKDGNGAYEVIDGQQRLTTLFLTICAFRELYMEQGYQTAVLEKMIKYPTINAKGEEEDKYKLELQYVDSSNILFDIANNSLNGKNLVGSAYRIYQAYDSILKFFRDQFNKDYTLLKKYFAYIFRKVKFIQIETPAIDDALKIFETINERGKSLNPMDLLKNLIFRQVSREKFSSLKDEWKAIIILLDKNNEKPLRFLRYFIMSNYKVNDPRGDEIIREDEIYSWITKEENQIQCNYVVEPFKFVQLMEQNAKSYIGYYQCQDEYGYNIYLDNIKKLGGGAFKQHLILLLAARHLSKELFDHLAKQLENLVAIYLITKVQAKIYEKNFSKWAKNLLEVKNKNDLNRFIKKFLEPEYKNRKRELEIRFQEMTFNSMQAYRIRYVLAKIYQYIDQGRQGAFQDQDLKKYITKGIEIEHILPWNPEPDLKQSFGENIYYDYKIK